MNALVLYVKRREVVKHKFAENGGESMGIYIDISVEPDHVYQRWTGTYSLNEAKRGLQSAIDSALESDRSRVLVDAFGVTGDIPFMERYEIGVFIAEYISAHALGKIWKIAVASHEPPIDPGRFAETVAVNLGAHQFRATTSIDEAFEWLNL